MKAWTKLPPIFFRFEVDLWFFWGKGRGWGIAVLVYEQFTGPTLCLHVRMWLGSKVCDNHSVEYSLGMPVRLGMS